MTFDSDTEASGPRLSPLGIAGWGAAFGVALLMLWVVEHYRLSAEFGMVSLGFVGLVIVDLPQEAEFRVHLCEAA